MPNELLASLRHLSDLELVARLKSLVAREREATVRIVAHLAELDTRDVYLREGFPSLFVYCRDILGLSEHEAYNRIDAARTVRRFPQVLEMLAEGAVNLTTVRLLAPHLSPANCRGVLESARGKKKAEVEEIVARLSPRPDVTPSLRKLPVAKRSPLPTAENCLPSLPLAVPSSPPLPPTPAPRSPVATPLAPDRYKLQLTISGGTLEKLRLAKDMLGHAIPSGDDAAVLDRALTALLTDLAKRKFAATDEPRPSRRPAPGTRHVPAEVRRAVWLRDLGRCAFLGTAGRRCNERRFLEFHHVQAHAAGGEASVANIQLRCRRHNNYEARVFFGISTRSRTGRKVTGAPSPGPGPG